MNVPSAAKLHIDLQYVFSIDDYSAIWMLQKYIITEKKKKGAPLAFVNYHLTFNRLQFLKSSTQNRPS